MDLESKWLWLMIFNFDYATIGSYALLWDCSLTEAIERLYTETVKPTL